MPAAAFAAICTLALGTGANVTVISAVRGALVDRVSYPDASRLVQISKEVPRAHSQLLSYDEYAEIVSKASAFSSSAACAFTYASVRGDNAAVLADVGRVTQAFFAIFGTPALRGRVLYPIDFASATGAVVISAALRDSIVGVGAEAIGRVVFIGGAPFTVVGVMPPSFLPRCAGERKGGAAWLPFSDQPPKGLGSNRAPAVFARLRPNMSLGDAQNQLNAIAPLGSEHAPPRVVVDRFGAADAAAVAPGLAMLQWGAGAVLLMTCIDIAILMLVVGVRWRRELSVRAMLGAGRGALVWQLTVQALSVTTLGALLGLLLAQLGMPLIVRLAGPLLPPGTPMSLRWPDLVIGIGLGLVTAAISGVGPALFVTRKAVAGAKQLTITRSVTRVYGGLILVQAAVTVAVLVGALLLTRSFVHVIEPPLAFDPSGLTVAADITAPPGLQTRTDYFAFERRLEDRLRATFPNEPTAIGDWVPSGLSATTEWTLLAPDGSEQRAGIQTSTRAVSRDFFDVLGIPIVTGRSFPRTEADDAAVVVTEEFVRRFARGVNVIGFQLKRSPSQIYPIIGIAANARGDPFRVEFLDAVYVPIDQDVATRWSIAVRSNDPSETARRLRDMLRSFSPDSAVDHVTEDLAPTTRRPTGERYFYVLVLLLFATLVAIEAGVGIFGSVSHLVALRTREWAVRVAVGAPSRTIASAAARSGFLPAALGTGGGLSMTWIAVSRIAPGSFIGSQLYHLAAHDAVTFAAVPVVVVVVCAAACAIPVRRATKTDPVQMLRAE